MVLWQHSASTWVWWYQVDLQYVVIRLFEFVGLASSVIVAPPSKLRAGYTPNLGHVFGEWLALLACVSALWWADRILPCLRRTFSAKAHGPRAGALKFLRVGPNESDGYDYAPLGKGV